MKSDVEKILRGRIEPGQYLPMNKCKNNLKRALFVLVIAKREFGVDGLSASEIATMLRRKFSTRTSPQAIRWALDGDDGEYVNITISDKNVKTYHATKKAENEYVLEKEGISMDFGERGILLPFDIFKDKKDYIKEIVLEINGCYRDNYFTACVVMIRRLFETLIVEAYETKGIEEEIKNNGDYLSLEKLIGKCINQPKIKLSKATKNQLPKIKLFGDHGAHNRKYVGKKIDIEKDSAQIRIAAEELARELA